MPTRISDTEMDEINLVTAVELLRLMSHVLDKALQGKLPRAVAYELCARVDRFTEGFPK